MVGVITMLLFTAKTNAQMLNVAATPDSSFVVDKVYAGALATSRYLHDSNESKQFDKFASVRVGASVVWKVSPKFALRSLVAAEYEVVGKTSLSFQAFWLQYQPHKKWLTEIGIGPTLTAGLHRPHPVTHWGQFEPFTKAQFPGVAPRAQIKYLPSGTTMIGAGVGIRQGMPEYQLAANIGSFQLSAFHQECTRTTGLGLGYAKGRWTSTSIWKSDDLIANISSFMLHRKQQLMLYTDFGYSLPKKDVIRFEAGLIKLVQAGYIKSIIGMGYSYEAKAIKAYLFVSL
ncbi:hypothetical protein KBC03_02935 [Patescibacteria group bacterium]|nr:hypothetical protein [Patescibacteria group bacterium]